MGGELAGNARLRGAHERADAARRGARRSGREALVVINRRIDVALALGADGAHLGFDALGVEDARRLVSSGVLLGVSTHSRDEVESAARAGADYVHLAPVFDPLSKRSTRPALGVAAVAAASRGGVRVVAQGGVTLANAGELVRNGAAGVAVTGAILQAADPAEAARELRQALDAAGEG